MTRLRFALAAASVAALTAHASATRYYVDDDSLGGTGLSWSQAFTTLQQALLAVDSADDEIWVAKGTYIPTDMTNPPDARSATFQIEENGVEIYGGFPYGGVWEDRDPIEYPTILSGDLLRDDDTLGKAENAYHVVQFEVDLDDTTIFDGFHVTDGYGYHTIEGQPGQDGAGIYMTGPTYPRIAKCMIYDNHTAVGFAKGGGVFIGNNATPVFTDCTITANSAERGGGVLCDRSYTDFINCDISGNTGSSYAGGIAGSTATPTDSGRITLTNCTGTGNVGTGVFADAHFTLNITGGEISGNTIDVGWSGGGAGVSCDGSGGTIDDVLITGNTSDSTWVGGGVYLNGADCDVTIKNCEISGNTAINGGGISCSGSAHPMIRNCDIMYNAASLSGVGGGIDCGSGTSPTIRDCLFEGNEADYGGGIHNYGEPTITGCTFRENKAFFGAGLYNYGSPSPLSDCIFIGNTKRDDMIDYGWGGAIYNGAPLEITRCIFLSNDAARGGGIYNRDSSGNTAAINCVFVANTAYLSGGMSDGWGGGVYNGVVDSVMTMINCTLHANHAEDMGGGLYVMSGHVDVINCIFWDNSDVFGGPMGEIATDVSGTVDVNYCNVEGGWGTGMGNIATDPVYRDADGDDDILGTEDDNLRLWLGGPCSDAGDNDAVVDVTTDLDSAPRVLDDPQAAETGHGDPPIVDMGAYELADCQPNGFEDDIDIATGTSYDENGNGVPDECEPCVGDIDGDGDTDQSDLGILLSCYNLCEGDPGYDPAADLNGDGCVNQPDLGIFLGDYGCGT